MAQVLLGVGSLCNLLGSIVKAAPLALFPSLIMGLGHRNFNKAFHVVLMC